MLNVVVLSGRLTQDPELKTTPNGISVCSFSIAVERRFRSGDEHHTTENVAWVVVRDNGKWVLEAE